MKKETKENSNVENETCNEVSLDKMIFLCEIVYQEEKSNGTSQADVRLRSGVKVLNGRYFWLERIKALSDDDEFYPGDAVYSPYFKEDREEWIAGPASAEFVIGKHLNIIGACQAKRQSFRTSTFKINATATSTPASTTKCSNTDSALCSYCGSLVMRWNRFCTVCGKDWRKRK